MNPDATTESKARRQLEILQAELAERDSTLHFAHAAVAMVVALILAGGTGKLFWDLPATKLYLGIPAVVVTALLVVYSLARYVRGKRVLRGELERFESMKALRRDLHLDDPAALLPR